MFNVGFGELVFILGLALLVLGPRKLPELARGIGRFMREFRRQSEDIRHTMEREFYKLDRELEEPLPKLGPPEGTFSSAPLHQAPPLPEHPEGPMPDATSLEAHPEPPPAELLAASPPFRGVAVGLEPQGLEAQDGATAAAAGAAAPAAVTAPATDDAGPARVEPPGTDPSAPRDADAATTKASAAS